MPTNTTNCSQRIKAAFNRAYVAPDGRIEGDTQTDYVLALSFDLLDGAPRNWPPTIWWRTSKNAAGIFRPVSSAPRASCWLSRQVGRDDVAWRLIHNDTFPSWGFSIKHGATSIWERWDGWTPEKGFQDPGMNSFAHYSFGAVYQWMVENIGGIRSTAPPTNKSSSRPIPMAN